jgi:hypothetical protein
MKRIIDLANGYATRINSFKKEFWACALFLILASAGIVIAAAPFSSIIQYETGGHGRNLIDGSSCGSSSALRTITQTTAGYAKLVQYIAITDPAATLTSVTVTCQGSVDGSSFGAITTRSVTAGAGTVYALVDTYATAADKHWVSVHDVWGISSYKCTYACVGGSPNWRTKLYVMWSAAVGK